MSSDVKVRVRDNLSALSAEGLHRAFKEMVRSSIREMRDFGRGVAPKRGGFLAEHVEDDEVSELANVVVGRVGVKPVEQADARRSSGRYRRSQYPLFVESGTRSPIFPARATAMWNVSEGIFGREQVRGQEANPFMFATFVQGREVIRADPHVRLALEEMAARAEAMKPEVEAA